VRGFNKKFPFTYFLVGGQVRDQLLGHTSKDFDFVVIGSSPEELVSFGLIPVGKSFPVFLDPETKDEYALARKEIKKGRGHQDFEFIFDSTITLEDDLLRRDFTINALCMDEQGVVIDQFQGLKDLELKILRHISKHFVEDPLRVFRAAKFAARLGFDIAPETYQLMKGIVKNGEINHLSIERIKAEFDDALISNKFEVFVEVLKEVGCWQNFEVDFKDVSKLDQIKSLEHKWIYSGTIAYPYSESSEKNNRLSAWKSKYRLNNHIEHLTMVLRYFIFISKNNYYQDEKTLQMLSYFQDGKNEKAIVEFSDLIKDLIFVLDLKNEWITFQKVLNHFKELEWGSEKLSSKEIVEKKMKWLEKIVISSN
jgi:tRNA nucleotidyltransferase/poly(A) polymerase